MDGAREYAKLFDYQSQQHGRLYLAIGKHARGYTLRIYVLPEGVVAKENGHNGNAPLNKDAIEVYGVTGGQPGWTETYGWLHEGRWQDDFEKLVEARRTKVAAEKMRQEEAAQSANDERAAHVQALLASY